MANASSTRRTFKNTSEVLREIFADSGNEDNSSEDDDFDIEDSDVEDNDDSDSDAPAVSERASSDDSDDNRPLADIARATSFRWTNASVTPAVFQFTDCPGINPDMLETLDDEPTALNYMSLFLHDDLVDIIVRETNRYAQQYIDSTVLKNDSRVRGWTPTNRCEMKLFFGLALLMGLIKKTDIEFYWSETDIFLTPAFSRFMTRNRFCTILKFLHFANNENKPTDKDDDRLYEIREVYDAITAAFASAYVPSKEVFIDEGMIRWFGRGFKTYLPSKRAKYGMKAYKVCDKSGYTFKFQLYVGHSEYSDLQHSVMHLMDGLLDYGRMLYMDNFYNSPELAFKLYKCKTHVVGTLRMTRKGVPKDLKDVKMKKR